MQKVELKAQEDLKKLREDSVPESVQRIIQDVKKIYAQRTYHINGGFGIYDGMEVLWDKKTEEVQNIILSVKIGSNTLHFHVDPDNEYLLRNSQPDIFGDGKSQDI